MTQSSEVHHSFWFSFQLATPCPFAKAKQHEGLAAQSASWAPLAFRSPRSPDGRRRDPAGLRLCEGNHWESRGWCLVPLKRARQQAGSQVLFEAQPDSQMPSNHWTERIGILFGLLDFKGEPFQKKRKKGHYWATGLWFCLGSNGMNRFRGFLKGNHQQGMVFILGVISHSRPISHQQEHDHTVGSCEIRVSHHRSVYPEMMLFTCKHHPTLWFQPWFLRWCEMYFVHPQFGLTHLTHVFSQLGRRPVSELRLRLALAHGSPPKYATSSWGPQHLAGKATHIDVPLTGNGWDPLANGWHKTNENEWNPSISCSKAKKRHLFTVFFLA